MRVTNNVNDNGQAVIAAISSAVGQDELIAFGASKSIGANRRFRESTHWMSTVVCPGERLFLPLFKKFRLPIAVARFIWFMSGNNRLADIAYYDAGARRFSDDGFCIPGSDFGRRVIAPRPGLNQLAKVIQLLRDEPFTRRAAISIYQPEDCGRDSRDIPCAMGLSFHIRNGALQTTVIMRSNNAFGIMPYNLFEFSLLAEIVACEVQVALGSLTYFALSMHVYEEDVLAAEDLLQKCSLRPALAVSIGTMPDASKPLHQIGLLCNLETHLRGIAQSATRHDLQELILKSREELSPFWQPFLAVLVWFVAARRADEETKQAIMEILPVMWANNIAATDVHPC